MADARDDLLATSEAIQDDADLLAELEKMKESLDADDPRMPELARRTEALARRMANKASAERELIDELHGKPM